jgi:anti-sigma B factor antagonist
VPALLGVCGRQVCQSMGIEQKNDRLKLKKELKRMNFIIDNKDSLKVIRLNGERLDTKVAPELKTQLLLLINDSSKTLIDLTKVQYADSSGLGALLLGVRQAREQKAYLAIFGAQKRVKNIIHIAQLDKLLVNYEDEASALDAMKKM